MATLFFSYSHKDESLRNQLETQLAALQRQGLIQAWHDRRITAGSEVDSAIDSQIEEAEIILLLVSPDFIASDYCCERELAKAMQRHRSGDARVIPVILRPCDWHDLTFGRLMAAPKDGKPITMWANADEAFLDVVKSIKAALQEVGRSAKMRGSQPRAVAPKPEPVPTVEVARSSNLRIRKEFTDLDKDRFLHEGFEYISNFFENSMTELVARNPGLEETFRRIDQARFTAAVYRHGKKVCVGLASIGDGTFGRGGIEYSITDAPIHGGMNEAVYVKADEQALFFEPLGMQPYGRNRDKLTHQGAAELFWSIFIGPLQH